MILLHNMRNLLPLHILFYSEHVTPSGISFLLFIRYNASYGQKLNSPRTTFAYIRNLIERGSIQFQNDRFSLYTNIFTTFQLIFPC